MQGPLSSSENHLLTQTVQNGRHSADDSFNFIFLHDTFCILIEILLRFVHKDPINNKLALVRIVDWQTIIWINDGLIYWRIYGSLGLNWLNQYYFNKHDSLFHGIHWR